MTRSEEDDTDECPYCRRTIYDDAVQCPHCCNYLSREDAPGRKSWWIIACAALCLAAVLWWILW